MSVNLCLGHTHIRKWIIGIQLFFFCPVASVNMAENSLSTPYCRAAPKLMMIAGKPSGQNYQLLLRPVCAYRYISFSEFYFRMDPFYRSEGPVGLRGPSRFEGPVIGPSEPL